MDIKSVRKIKVGSKEIPFYLLHEYSKHIVREKNTRSGKTIIRDLGDIYAFEKGREAIHDLIVRAAGFTPCGCGGIFRSVEPEQKDDYKVFCKDLDLWIKNYITTKGEVE